MLPLEIFLTIRRPVGLISCWALGLDSGDNQWVTELAGLLLATVQWV